jgi:hypothetical protein
MFNIIALLLISVSFMIFYMVKDHRMKLERIPIKVRSESKGNKPGHSKAQE